MATKASPNIQAAYGKPSDSANSSTVGGTSSSAVGKTSTTSPTLSSVSWMHVSSIAQISETNTPGTDHSTLATSQYTLSSPISFSSPTPTHSSEADGNQSQPLTSEQVAGVVIAAVTGGLLVFVPLIWWCLRARRRRADYLPMNGDPSTGDHEGKPPKRNTHEWVKPELDGLEARTHRDGMMTPLELDGGILASAAEIYEMGGPQFQPQELETNGLLYAAQGLGPILEEESPTLGRHTHPVRIGDA